MVAMTMPISVHSWVGGGGYRGSSVTHMVNVGSKDSALFAKSSSKNPNNQQRTDMLLDSIETPPTGPSVDPSMTSKNVEDDEFLPLVYAICKAADDRKADNIVATRVSASTSLTDWIVICSGNSRPQNNAIASNIRDEIEKHYGDEFSLLGNGVPEGNADSGWIVLDYASVMVHIMTPKSRLFYDIEGKWNDESKGDVQNLDLTPILVPNSVLAQQESTTEEETSEEDDPFWS
eukprot:CAMPEP_0197832064 /NCGR_PEP_ID=MMETSP1437-20131217/13134_1 /TAXON_ID=49252 ORGANISM="Eucampia antarctica, Strain CCMP1452" /NCGR_SAMPLE_ID=MMETSP1437 /ASSEMBLY_ACC=CAM_ASM_001096 /LENGTH=232 /DNA_ID=CAMNT_0043435241 /DNA_START=232 /DNA_END=930 /DNA_ORIENTATION=-